METNDAAIVADVEVDQMLRARNNGSGSKPALAHERTNKPGASSSSLDMDEQAPLLEDGERSSHDGDDEETEWFGITEIKGLPWWKRPSVRREQTSRPHIALTDVRQIYWLLPPFLLFSLAFGGIVVPKLNLIMDLVCEEYYASQDPDPISGPMDPGLQPDRCQNDAVSARSSLFLLYGNLCSGILSAITSPKLGALSDRYGRKPLMIFTTLGIFMGEILTILAAKKNAPPMKAIKP